MGSSGGGGDGGGREPGRNAAAKKAKKKAENSFPSAPKPKLSDRTPNLSERRSERQPNNPFKTSRGPSPGDVKATFGAVEGVDTKFTSRGKEYNAPNRDIVAANVAGRPGLNVGNMGDLATRARVGQLPPAKVQVPGVGTAALNLLNTVGMKSAGSLMRKIASDTPTTVDGKVTYGTKLVKDDNDKIMGIVDKSGAYSGRPDFNPTPTPKGESDKTSTGITAEDNKPKKPSIPEETTADAARRSALLGGGSSAAQRLLLQKKKRKA